jgi:4-hydroxybenzoate polyprenyltransferase
MQVQNIPEKPKPVALTREWAEMIKLEHTVFALPFALSGLILAAPTLPSI